MRVVLLLNMLFVLLLSQFSLAATIAPIAFNVPTSMDQMLSESKIQHKPFVLLVTIDECAICKKMDMYTYNYEPLVDYTTQNYLAYKIDAFDFDKGGINIAQQLDVNAFPTIVVFDEDGTRMGNIKGYYSGPNLLAEFKLQKSVILKRHENPSLAELKPIVPIKPLAPADINNKAEVLAKMKAKITMPEYSETERTFPSLAEAAMIEEEKAAEGIAEVQVNETPLAPVKVEVTESKAAAGPQGPSTSTIAYGVVESQMERSLLAKKPLGYGIEVMETDNVTAMNERMQYLGRRWKKDIWVYAMTVNGNTSYVIMLGSFEDRETAEEWRENIKEMIPNVGKIVEFSKIK